MNLLKQNISDILIITLEEKDANLSKSEQFKELIFTDIDAGAIHLIISFEKVEYIDSSFLGALVAILKKIMILNGKLVISNLNDDILNLFELTRLDKVFNLKQSIETALQEF